MSLSYSHDQLGLVWHNQNLQRALISQISNWSGTIFDCFLLQIGFRTTEYFYLILEISQQILRFESKTQIKNFTICYTNNPYDISYPQMHHSTLTICTSNGKLIVVGSYT